MRSKKSIFTGLKNVLKFFPGQMRSEKYFKKILDRLRSKKKYFKGSQKCFEIFHGSNEVWKVFSRVKWGPKNIWKNFWIKWGLKNILKFVHGSKCGHKIVYQHIPNFFLLNCHILASIKISCYYNISYAPTAY